MKALVINQDSQVQRMAFQTEQLEALGIDFQRVSTFSIQGSDDPVYKRLYKKWQRPLSIAEVSCFLSHTLAWEIIIARNEPMLVLEDDAWLDENIAGILKELNNIPDIDYATLEVTGANRKKLIAKKPSNSLTHVDMYRLYQDRSGSGGYVLWPSGATKLLGLVAKGKIALADKFLSSCLSLNAYQIEPGVIIQLDQCSSHGITPPLEVKSTISTKTKTKSQLMDTIRYKVRRMIGEAKIGLNLLSHAHHAKRRPLTLSTNFKKRSNQQ